MVETAKRTFQCTVITPKGTRLACAAESAEVPAHDGQLGVLCHRAPLFCQLTLGLMSVTEIRDQSDAAVHHQLIIDRGFMIVADNSLTVIAYDAITQEDLQNEQWSEHMNQLDSRLEDASRSYDQHRHDEREKALIERLTAAQSFAT